MKAPIMYSPMMGIGASIDLYTETPAVTIEDVMFDNTTVGELAPLESPKDYHDTWDLDGTDFTPEVSPDDEGFWDDFENIVLNGDYEELGSELVTNGSFDVDANWTFAGTNASISNGVGVFPDATSSFIIQSSVVPASVKTYKLVYEVTKTNEGALFLAGGSSAFGTVSLTNTVGTHTKFVTSNGTQRNLQFSNQTHFVGEIDNISLKQVDPNDRWILGTGWSISDGKARYDASSGDGFTFLKQTNIFQAGDYEITFTLGDLGGSFAFNQAGIVVNGIVNSFQGFAISSAGTHTIRTSFDGPRALHFYGHPNGDDFSIDNVQVEEYAIKPLDV